MKKLLLLSILLFATTSVLAQYNGPAVEACRAYALKELQREGTKVSSVVFERDNALILDRYTRKLGSQFVSSVLMGNGAVVLEGTPSSELQFVCLLADEKRPVFFTWMPRSDTSALLQCVRSQELKGKPRPCLELLQRITEQDLTVVYAQRFQEANERGEKVLAAYRKSNDEWLQFRDAECTRRRDFPPQGVAPEDVQLACVVDLTRRRAFDMR